MDLKAVRERLAALEARKRKIERENELRWKLLITPPSFGDQGQAVSEVREHYRTAIEAAEREFVLNALDKTDWNVARAARAVGLSRRVFAYKMRKLNVGKSVSDE